MQRKGCVLKEGSGSDSNKSNVNLFVQLRRKLDYRVVNV